MVTTVPHPSPADPHLPETPCPYCARTMRWMDGKRPGSGWFECERCGTFDVQGWAPPQYPRAVCSSA
jgi:endogenous inhibitor of DNA gyrase (YacG/DUF329 family)